jgi:hypothetical protein
MSCVTVSGVVCRLLAFEYTIFLATPASPAFSTPCTTCQALLLHSSVECRLHTRNAQILCKGYAVDAYGAHLLMTSCKNQYNNHHSQDSVPRAVCNARNGVLRDLENISATISG